MARNKIYSEKVEKLFDDLNTKLQDFRNNDSTYKEFLDTVCKFHNYSVNNILLISQQRPDATNVAGYNTWKNKFDRQVNKGAKGIKIFAPIVKKVEKDLTDKNGNIIYDKNNNPKKVKTPTIVGFKAHTVFDISDTKGKPLITAKDLIKSEFEDSNVYKSAYDSFRSFLNGETRITVEESSSLSDEIHGYYTPSNDQIIIKDNLSYDMKFKTLIHEYAHSQLHNTAGLTDTITPEQESIMELEAESSAYVISKYYGLDTSDFSLGYIGQWTSHLSDDEIKNHIKNVHKFAQRTIEEINDLPEISQYLEDKLESRLDTQTFQEIDEMISRNLKNGFDKITIIKGNLENKYGFMEMKENEFTTERLRVNFEYDDFDTNNIKDTCKIRISNYHNKSLNKEFNYSQTYDRNLLNNTTTITVTDENSNDNKKYEHLRKLDGSLLLEGQSIEPSEEIVNFEKFINNSVSKEGLLNTMAKFINNGHSMGYSLNVNDNIETDETNINMSKTDKNGFKSLLTSKVEHDQKDNIYVEFKIKNAEGIKVLNFTDTYENFEKSANIEKKTESEIDL
ncbi:ArdC family protein [Staphylococcus aureus]|uniref:ArdC family protein n=1 Tax=Staphylococcus aureus TaxID=1280 RepID=UPI00201A4D09|nr:ArdC family protein [Staphylococcus aureus]MCL4579441.1 LtrC [Staphylococcus aureus]